MNNNSCILLLLFFIILYISASALAKTTAPKLQLATIYSSPSNIEDYYISEKLDGVRGYWDGHKLYTRRGNLLSPPAWYTDSWPQHPLDGELWIKRNSFEQVISCVRRVAKNDPCWRQVKFMIFDLPHQLMPFSDRVTQMQRLINQSNSIQLEMIEQYKIKSITALHEKLALVVKERGEGLMLHHQDARYKVGRADHLMKLKQYQDAEAVVIEHITGKGKYNNMLGAIKVKTEDGIVFKIGSGFSDEERKHPPAIGSIITYKFIGKTQRGVPRFASFIRIRK